MKNIFEDLTDKVEAAINQEYKDRPEMSVIDKATILNELSGRLYKRMLTGDYRPMTKVVDYIRYIFDSTWNPADILSLNYKEFANVANTAVRFISQYKLYPYQFYMSLYILLNRSVPTLSIHKSKVIDAGLDIDEIAEEALSKIPIQFAIEKIDTTVKYYQEQANNNQDNTGSYLRYMGFIKELEDFKERLQARQVNK